MNQIVVISGKGGSGKTTLTSSLVYLSKNIGIADCDVETPNLDIMLKGKNIHKKKYIGGKIASIDKEKCISCYKCKENCRFSAIDDSIMINELSCEGCGVCEFVCPTSAIKLIDDETGTIYLDETEKGYFSHARLTIGADGAGKVVSEVRKELQKITDCNDILIDGSPGIGCVVIASLTGCEAAVVVTEPTQSGLEDLKRVMELVEYFNIKGLVVINKCDLNNDMTTKIEEYCKMKNFIILGKVPFDKCVSKAVKEGKPVVTYENSVAATEIYSIWENLKKYNNI
ncbi:ATP-binding protein [Abyssisolibacter fermentans]|uniref:ATP-binding protein n=1 Tax=Abyssisolibacter fermentans TaxID=1766203 RepID=UPI00082C68F2|nr:ATP-binding protein [Abyssisolibacter fermentans]